MEYQSTDRFILEYQADLKNVLVTYPEIETTNYLRGLPVELLQKVLRLQPREGKGLLMMRPLPLRALMICW